ncbi:MAG TPA: hypothetical protein DCZ40_13495 [Lachnospiraceae bacterium]|nr:hypothetical protein [Lachnospiraceae bacterium]
MKAKVNNSLKREISIFLVASVRFCGEDFAQNSWHKDGSGHPYTAGRRGKICRTFRQQAGLSKLKRKV